MRQLGIGLAVVIGLVILFTFSKSSQEQRELQSRAVVDKRCAEISPEETIFISIVADSPQVAYTMFHIFENSFCPFRVFMGVCQVVHPNHQFLDILEEYSSYASRGHDFSDNIRVYSVVAPCSEPRKLIEQHLYRGEKYYFHVDANVIFTKFWDQECISQLRQCSADKPILTMIPLEVEMGKVSKPSFMRVAFVSQVLNETELEGALFVTRPRAPTASPFLSSQFLFTYATSFFGVADASDYVLSATFWTRGYDFFQPTMMIVTKMLSKNKKSVPQKMMIMMPQLGSIRSLASFEAWCGVRQWPKFVVAPTAYAGLNVVQSETEQIQQKYGSRKLYQQRLLHHIF